ncbi:MAG TPA: ABC transporter substrate-binding protein [Candidatus Binatia bacterium]|jgi:ABC-type nitrate/sulfonate/bicarbonate transport system substrate-binding protein
MGQLAKRWILSLSILALSPPASAHSQPKSPPEKKLTVGVIYEALSATNAPLWLAQDLSLYDKYGLDVKVIHARGAIPVQAVVGGSVEFGAFSGSSTIAANLAGSDLVFIAAKPNFSVISVWTRKDSPLKNLAELKGKTLGVTRAGSATHAIARLALRNAGVGDKEVKFLHHGGLPEIFASLDQGLVDVAFASAPRPGFREMIDLSTAKIPFLQGAIEVRREFLSSRRPVVLSFLRAYLESLKAAKDKPELAVAAVARRLRVTPEVARGGYPPHARALEEVPYVRADSVQAIVDLFAADKAEATSRFIDNSALKELVDSGFVRELYQR